MQRLVRTRFTRQLAVTLGCLVAWRLLFLVPLPITNPALVGWQEGINTYRGVLAVLEGPTLRAFTVGALGLSPFLTAFVVLWCLWAISPQMRDRWESRQVMNRDLGWGTLVMAAISAFGRVRGLVHADTRMVTSGRGLLSMLLLVLGTMVLFGLGSIISQAGAPSGYGVWFLYAVQSLLGGLHQLGHVMNVGPLDGALMVAVSLYAVVSLVLLVSTIWITSAVRLVKVERSDGKPSDEQDSVPLRPVQGSLIAAAVLPSLLIQAPRWLLAPLLGQDLAGIDRYWSAISPIGQVVLAYHTVYFLLIIAFNVLAMWLNFSPDYVVERLRRRGRTIARPSPMSPSDYLGRVAFQLNIAGGIWLAAVVVLVPAMFNLAFGASDLYVGGPIFVISAAILVDSVRRAREGYQ